MLSSYYAVRSWGRSNRRAALEEALKCMDDLGPDVALWLVTEQHDDGVVTARTERCLVLAGWHPVEDHLVRFLIAGNAELVRDYASQRRGDA